MKLSGIMMDSLDGLDGAYNYEDYSEGVSLNIAFNNSGANNVYEKDMLELDPDNLMSIFGEENLAPLGILSAFGDTTATLLLIFMIVTMYSAGAS